jgi:hypothetical protein
MYYRLRVGTADGEERGYQWREIDTELFASVATGQQPEADAAAQELDSSEFDSAAQDRKMFYLAVWDPVNNTWVSNSSDPENDYSQFAHSEIGA